MLCPNCGGENREDYKFCAHCGAPRPQEPVQDIKTINVPEPPPVNPPPPAPQPPPAWAPERLVPPPANLPSAPPRKKFSWLAACLVALLAGLCLLVAIVAGIALLNPSWLPFDLPFLGSSSHMLVGFPDPDGETDLYLLKSGQAQESGTLLKKGAVSATATVIYLEGNEVRRLGILDQMSFGGFIPGENTLLYWFEDGSGRITLDRQGINQDTPVTLFDGAALSLWGGLTSDRTNLFLSQRTGDHERCLLSLSGAEPTRAFDGNNCILNAQITHAFAVEMDNTQATLRAVSLADGDEATLLDGVEDFISFKPSGDGSRVAYVAKGEGERVNLLDSADGTTLIQGEQMYSIIDYGFARNSSNGWYIGDTESGDLQLYTLTDNTTSLVASGSSLAADLSDDGQTLVYLVGDSDGKHTVFVHNMTGGDDVEVVSGGELLTFSIFQLAERIMIIDQQSDDLFVYSAGLDGGGLVTLFEDSNQTLVSLSGVQGEAALVIELINSDGQFSAFVTPPDTNTGSMIARDWADLAFHNVSPDGSQLLFSGRKDTGDDASLFVVPLSADSDPLVLDVNLDSVANAVFTGKGDQVLFTAVTGSSPDEVEIRRVSAAGSEPSEVLYSPALLIDTQWSVMNPFVSFNVLTPQVSTAYCPGADPITAGGTASGSLVAGEKSCYRFNGLADQSVTFYVGNTGGLDTMLTLYTRDGQYIASDDFGMNGVDPRLIATLPEDGTYYLEVTAPSGNAGGFDLSLLEGANFCPGVPPISIGQSQQGDLSTTGRSYFGFSGNANQDVSVWVESANMDPMLSMYDQTGAIVGSDDNSRDGVDPLLNTTLLTTGNYCLEVSSFFGAGTFNIAMEEGTVFCPGAGSIALGDSLDGSLDSGRRTCYSFSAAAGTTYSFLVNSPTSTDTVLELYDTGGSMIDSDDDSGGNLNPRLVFTVDRAGDYYIMVRAFDTSAAGTYSLRFAEGAGFCEDPAPISSGDTVSGFIDSGQQNCYSFSGTPDQPLEFVVDADADTVLILYDENLTEISRDDDTGGNLNPLLYTVLPASGNYFLTIQGYSTNPANYTLIMRPGQVYPDPFDNATPIAAGTRVRDTIGDNDRIVITQFNYSTWGTMYTFEGTAGQTIQIDVFADSLGSQIDPYVILFDTNKEYLSDDDDSGDGYDSQLVTTLPETGRYYILVQDVFNSHGDPLEYWYEILVTFP